MTDLNEDGCIEIKQMKDKFFIFKSKDVEKLRCEHRIVGALNGTLPQYPLQNTFFGLPLILLPEEVIFLLKKGWGKIIKKSVDSNSIDILKDKINLKSIIFDYFWTKGYYITSGIKFGGDYLLYPNDPMCIHSEYIVSIRSSLNESINALEFINMGRLATTVKKAFVLTSVNEENNVISYSIEWAGF